MDNQAEVGEFLRTRRARVTPVQAGIVGGGRRRVRGLRREEVAMLAAVSTDYYAKMERGNLAGVSPEVLTGSPGRSSSTTRKPSICMTSLVRQPRWRSAVAPAPQRRPSGRRCSGFLDAITGAPAWVVNQRADILATNPLGRALLAPMLNDPANRQNNARFIFLSPASRTFYPDWEHGADNAVAALRSAALRNPYDKGLTDLIGELITRSDAFQLHWSAHNVRFHRTGTKRIHHPDVGDLEFTYEGLELPDSPGWMMFAYTTAAGSPSEERVKLLGSLAATRSEPSTAAASED